MKIAFGKLQTQTTVCMYKVISRGDFHDEGIVLRLHGEAKIGGREFRFS